MIVQHNDLCNLNLLPPPGMEDSVYAMHAWTNGERVVSWWKPDPEELAQLKEGGLVVLTVIGKSAPPVALQVEIAQPGHRDRQPHDPIPAMLYCPRCLMQHIDKHEWSHKMHWVHLCEKCGHKWQPCYIPTIGVKEVWMGG